MMMMALELGSSCSLPAFADDCVWCFPIGTTYGDRPSPNQGRASSGRLISDPRRDFPHKRRACGGSSSTSPSSSCGRLGISQPASLTSASGPPSKYCPVTFLSLVAHVVLFRWMPSRASGPIATSRALEDVADVTVIIILGIFLASCSVRTCTTTLHLHTRWRLLSTIH